MRNTFFVPPALFMVFISLNKFCITHSHLYLFITCICICIRICIYVLHLSMCMCIYRMFWLLCSFYFSFVSVYLPYLLFVFFRYMIHFIHFKFSWRVNEVAIQFHSIIEIGWFKFNAQDAKPVLRWAIDFSSSQKYDAITMIWTEVKRVVNFK